VVSLSVAGSNPFRDRTLIGFALPRASNVKLEVFDVAGKRVRTLVDGVRAAGYHQVAFALGAEGGRSLAAGVYLVRLSAGDERRKLTVIALR
jgi:hypothetical protein